MKHSRELLPYTIIGACLLFLAAIAGAANAASLTYDTDTNLYFSSSGVTFTVASSSLADTVVVSATNTVVSLSAATGGSFTITSTSTDIDVQTSGTAGSVTQTCSSGVAQVVISQSSGSATYTLSPTASQCVPAPVSYPEIIVGGGAPLYRPAPSSSGSQTATTTPPQPISTSTAPSTGSVRLTKNLRSGMRDPQIRVLQQFLNTHGVPLAKQGPGSLGNETDYFGPITHRAVIIFQEKYRSLILVPNGLLKGTGFVGPSTRQVINGM